MQSIQYLSKIVGHKLVILKFTLRNMYRSGFEPYKLQGFFVEFMDYAIEITQKTQLYILVAKCMN